LLLCDLETSEVLLMRDAAVHSDEHIETSFSLSEQRAALQASPANERNGFDGVTGQVAL
jgi:hypothetical protein